MGVSSTMSTKYYNLENEAAAHASSILETWGSWSDEEPDVVLISSQGTLLQTHKVFLKLYSKVLNRAWQDIPADTVPSIFIPASTTSLVNLISILSTGISISDKKEDLLDVVCTAELIGINLQDVQIGTKIIKTDLLKNE